MWEVEVKLEGALSTAMSHSDKMSSYREVRVFSNSCLLPTLGTLESRCGNGALVAFSLGQRWQQVNSAVF